MENENDKQNYNLKELIEKQEKNQKFLKKQKKFFLKKNTLCLQ